MHLFSSAYSLLPGWNHQQTPNRESHLHGKKVSLDFILIFTLAKMIGILVKR